MSTETKTSTGKVVLGVAAAVVVASIGNAIVSWVARELGADPAAVEGLQPKAYVVLTALGVVVAAVAWAVIRRRAEDPARTLGRLVPVVVVLSFLADVPLFFLPGASVVGVVALMVMHVVVAAVAVPIFHRVLPVRTPVDA
ncbi:hypothetical protein SAMN05216188_10544 [Lentzea xinjiangensis]|uniref:PEP-CTERM protein-sorting domain-containing protein n=1 Tax=Lentzea xinjiangensis TaxID=402600 RepID=A0A1H9IRA0_9PSEU|nr:DUF6069 family protein [Lentzea xinjiangensis]SEQ77114.1 hypothetical protein SAMN05216188_10544 [Lentzea xinjiangensis]